MKRNIGNDTTQHDEQLEQLLARVSPVPSCNNLAASIIANADPDFHLSEKENGLIQQIMRSFIFPKPAYALACSMLIGVFLGWQSTVLTDVTIATSDVQTLSIEEDLSRLFLAEVHYYE